jgi:hypothetical protein
MEIPRSWVMRPNLIITDWLSVMTYGGVERMMNRLEPFGQQRQLNGGLNVGVVRKDCKRFGNMPSAR